MQTVVTGVPMAGVANAPAGTVVAAVEPAVALEDGHRVGLRSPPAGARLVGLGRGEGGGVDGVLEDPAAVEGAGAVDRERNEADQHRHHQRQQHDGLALFQAAAGAHQYSVLVMTWRVKTMWPATSELMSGVTGTKL